MLFYESLLREDRRSRADRVEDLLMGGVDSKEGLKQARAWIKQLRKH
jgi:hypothetical protein